VFLHSKPEHTQECELTQSILEANIRACKIVLAAPPHQLLADRKVAGTWTSESDDHAAEAQRNLSDKPVASAFLSVQLSKE
jgi:hypothetical protein